MHRVKIYGAGSVGNHLAHAARHKGWEVAVCDISDQALERMKNQIYPSRYGWWDESIKLYNNRTAPKGGFDMIFIGTPPDHHLDLALEALTEQPKAILIEKPLCPPSLVLAQEFYEKCRKSAPKVFVGYEHVVGRATARVLELLADKAIGEVETIDVEFREHWGGIFAAHPWLNGPEDSYLGFWQRGGGASGEHSHAVNLWQHFAHSIGAGRVTAVNAMLKYVTNGKAVYDSMCFLELRTEMGVIGRVVQDVVTIPTRKRARIQGPNGSIEWISGYNTKGDAVILQKSGYSEEVQVIEKTRADDFIEEMKFLGDQLAGKQTSPAIDLERGLDTMLVVAAAHRSEEKKCRMRIEHDRGYTYQAIRPCLDK